MGGRHRRPGRPRPLQRHGPRAAADLQQPLSSFGRRGSVRDPGWAFPVAGRRRSRRVDPARPRRAPGARTHRRRSVAGRGAGRAPFGWSAPRRPRPVLVAGPRSMARSARRRGLPRSPRRSRRSERSRRFPPPHFWDEMHVADAFCPSPGIAAAPDSWRLPSAALPRPAECGYEYFHTYAEVKAEIDSAVADHPAHRHAHSASARATRADRSGPSRSATTSALTRTSPRSSSTPRSTLANARRTSWLSSSSSC